MFNVPKQEKKAPDKPSIFIDFKKTPSVEGVLVGKPYEFYTVWDKAVNRSQTVEPGTQGAKWKFKQNIVVVENGALTAKIIEGGAMIALAVNELKESGYDIEATKVKISKIGSGLETSYSVIVPPKAELTPDMVEKVKAVKLHELK